MPFQVRTTLSPGLQRLHHASTTSPITSISSQCQRRHKSDGPREGTGKVGYDKFRPVDRRDMKMPAQQSMQVSQKMQMRKNMPNDLGLLLGTLIVPHNMPALFSSPKQRLQMEFQRFVKRGKDLITVFSYSWTQKPRLKIHFFKTASTAQALHRQVYSALGDGDTNTISSLACEGLRTNLLSRISARPKHSTYAWTLHRYVGKPKVMSHRAAILPIDDGTGNKTAMRQAVVKIKSIQSLKRIDERATTDEREGKEMEIEEFVVVQRRVWRGIEERWRMWGTTSESRVEDWGSVMNPEVDAGQRQQTSTGSDEGVRKALA